jgi:hypothetical protein
MQKFSKATKKKRDAKLLRRRLYFREKGYLKRTDGKVTIIANCGTPIEGKTNGRFVESFG